MSDLMDLTYDNLNNVIKEITGEEVDEGRWNVAVRGVHFHLMHHRGTASGLEVSIRDVDWKKTFRRVRSLNGQISISRLKIVYGELREEYDTEIRPKKLENERRDNKVQGLNNIASSLSDASVTIYHDSTLRRGFSITVEGSEELIEDCLAFLEKRCGRKETTE